MIDWLLFLLLLLLLLVLHSIDRDDDDDNIMVMMMIMIMIVFGVFYYQAMQKICRSYGCNRCFSIRMMIFVLATIATLIAIEHRTHSILSIVLEIYCLLGEPKA